MKKIVFAALLCLTAIAQDAIKTTPGEAETHLIVRHAQSDVVVDVTRDLESPLAATPSDIQITFLPSGKVVPGTSIDPASVRLIVGTSRKFALALNSDAAALPEAGDRTYQIEIRNIAYAGAPGRVTLKATGTIYDASNIKSLVDATSQALSSAKTTEEKNLFAGVDMVVPNSAGAGAQVDLVFNQSISSLPRKLSRTGFADAGSFGAKIKKGAVLGNDPQHFSLGFSFRKTILLASRADLNTLRAATNPGAAHVPSEDALHALSQVRSHFWRAFLADYGFQMEGDVSDRGIGNVSNAILDVRPQIATAAKPILGERGYFTLRLMPVGLEVGHNLNNPDNITKEIGGISRYKAGAELRVFYQSKTDKPILNRVELVGASIYRRLFLTESALNAAKQTNVNTTLGDKLWTQVDFKVFVGPKMGKIRPGLKTTYQRGYLPPVFNRTKTFSYGLVFESTEGQTN
jgi:hypothetical protein